MTNFHKFLISTFATFAISASALANGYIPTSTPSYAQPGFIIGVDTGYGYVHSPESVYPSDSTFTLDNASINYGSTNDIGHWVWGAHVGYDFSVLSNFLFGCELGYKDLGRSNNGFALNISDSEEEIGSGSLSRGYHQSAVDFLFTAHYYPIEGLNFFGKIGAAYVRSSDSQQLDTSDISIDDENTTPIRTIIRSLGSGHHTIWRLEPEFSLGVGYTFSSNIDVYVAYNHTCGSSQDTTLLPTQAIVYPTNSISGGISYKFIN